MRRGQFHAAFAASRKHGGGGGGGGVTSRQKTVHGKKNGIDEPLSVVHVGPYHGVLSCMWYIIREEGDMTSRQRTSSTNAAAASSSTPTTSTSMSTQRRGQGIQGLWRGWRVGWWGLVGIWGAAALGGNTKGGEF